MVVKIAQLSPTAIIPKKGSEWAAGHDLCADIEDAITIPSMGTVRVPTGISMEIPQGYFGAIYARSGLATKRGLRPSNCVGVIDSDYRGEIIVALHNDSCIDQKIDAKERIAQIVIQPHLAINWEITDKLTETHRGDGGFGSTGK